MRQVKSLREIPSPIVLPFILVIGICTTFFRAFVLEPGSASLGVFFETIYYTCFAIFCTSLFLLIINFKMNSKSILLWIHLILGAPISLIYLYNISYNSFLNFVETTTPQKSRTEKITNLTLLNNYSRAFENLVDILVDVKVIGIKADSAHRYFFGSSYKDDIDRKFAVDLTPEIKGIKYLEFKVTNLFFHPSDNSYLVGFLTTKFINPYAITRENSNGIDFDSSLFIGKIEDSNFDMIVLGEYRLSCTSFEKCEFYMEKNFLKGMSKNFGFNINDSRFWEKNHVIERLEEHSQDLENNIWKNFYE